MIIHTVQQGDTLYSIANRYGVSEQRLAFDNQIDQPQRLVVGQAILVLIPETIHLVKSGETLYSIASQYQISVLQLIRNNPYLLNTGSLRENQALVIRYDTPPIGTMTTGGYCYPNINRSVLAETLPYLSELYIFSYGFTEDGTLVPIEDEELIAMARQVNVAPILVLTPSSTTNSFDSRLITMLTTNPDAENRLIENLLQTVRMKGYAGVDIDFEYILPEDRYRYPLFLQKLTTAMNAEGYTVSAALAPKTSSEQAGVLYEGVDYGLLGAAANHVLIMTYEWGYTYGPPMAVAPINQVRNVLNYAVTEIPPEKINFGIPNYGYDWALPFVRSTTKAQVIGNVEAVRLARDVQAAIQFDETAMSPFFEYTKDGVSHVVWFEDARSIYAKLQLVPEYGFRGVVYWNLTRFFRQNWMLVNSLFQIIPV